MAGFHNRRFNPNITPNSSRPKIKRIVLTNTTVGYVDSNINYIIILHSWYICLESSNVCTE